MFRCVIVLLLTLLMCATAVAQRGDEGDRDRDGDRPRRARDGADQRDPDRREERRERERRRRRRDRRPREERPSDEGPAEPKAETPKPDAPENTESKPETPQPQPTPETPLPEPAEKNEPKKVAAEKPDVVESDQSVDDFVLQGEYLGSLSSGLLAGKAGLQVVALGDGKFEAYLLQGGLPGNGWLRGSARPKFAGERDGALLALSGESYAIEVDGSTAKVKNAEGHALGEFKKVLRRSPTTGAAPAAGANILFAGASTEAFKSANVTDDGLLSVGALTKDPVGDFRMHLEFRTPFEPTKRGQGRGNSGIYIQERYEVQVLDSFGLAGDASECGGLYRQRKPDFNLCLPPLSWQTYDIYFTAAQFDAQGNKTANARITVFHNGIAVHDNVELTDKTGAGQKEEPTERPIRFQDHGNAVVYRNIWLVAGQGKAAADQECCP